RRSPPPKTCCKRSSDGCRPRSGRSPFGARKASNGKGSLRTSAPPPRLCARRSSGLCCGRATNCGFPRKTSPAGAKDDRSWSVPAEAYLQRFSALQSADEGALGLVLNEVHLRKDAGEQPTLAEFALRFPQFRDPLRDDFFLDDALARRFADVLNASPSSPADQT